MSPKIEKASVPAAGGVRKCVTTPYRNKSLLDVARYKALVNPPPVGLTETILPETSERVKHTGALTFRTHLRVSVCKILVT